MNLKILLPSGVFAVVSGLSSLVAETREGSFGVLPHRLDCVAALIPGLLTYTASGETVCLAADEGVLVKAGADVTVSIRHCVRGATLALLHAAVTGEFRRTSEQDRSVRLAVTKMASGIVGRFLELHRDR